MSSIYRFHVLAPPNTQTTHEYDLDGFTSATIRFVRMLKNLGHTVFLYGSEETDAPCDELITCITKKQQKKFLKKSAYQYAASSNCVDLWRLHNKSAIRAIASRKQDRDFICTIGGVAQQEVALAHPDLMCVEYSVGYIESFAQYRVFESQAWRHAVGGANAHGKFFDDVIPLFFDHEQFKPAKKKQNFALYVGRLTYLKGIGIACQAAELAGIPLKVIGHGDSSLVTNGAEYLGAVDTATRNAMMSKAQVLICPTQYVEPFGSVAVEAQLCGTPVVSTDFGGFTETIEHGKTGFRCHVLGDFVRGLKDAKTLDPQYIRQRAIDNYSMDVVQHSYQRYFDRLTLLWDKGWNTVEGTA